MEFHIYVYCHMYRWILMFIHHELKKESRTLPFLDSNGAEMPLGCKRMPADVSMHTSECC
jgi:hypothetical protein